MSVAAIGIGSGVASSLAVGFGATKIMDGIAAKHPTGSEADGPARGVAFAAGALGFLATAGGMWALSRGNVQLGAGLIGGGVGGMVGSFGATIAFGSRHGVGVETSVNDVLSSYDHNRNGQLDMEGSWWRGPETIRTTTTRHEDSNGHVWYDTDTYSIERMAQRADSDRNWTVTRPELLTTIGAYDADGNGRLQGPEAKRFSREIGEDFLG